MFSSCSQFSIPLCCGGLVVAGTIENDLEDFRSVNVNVFIHPTVTTSKGGL